ncbi:hypothetical protein SAMN04489740_2705 [Arthrobacter alpinus]|uniref:Uncharacterized protein n=1 Tax=Arthrobacter alpinus TaxID=656366 RepID=A0A1H5M3H3_9MICC|nr:hypothetical protein [Arthrobacter alpinus]SEE83048.1 hypothetical protein SAMN04489740_2705 [Arthrobacter alpinus]
MTEFWWGVLSLPIIVLAAAAAVGATIGAWHLIDQWSQARWRKLPPVEMPVQYGDPKGWNGWTLGKSGTRGAFLSLLLTGMKGFTVRITSGLAIMVVYGTDKRDQQRSAILYRALDKAMADVCKEMEDERPQES